MSTTKWFALTLGLCVISMILGCASPEQATDVEAGETGQAAAISAEDASLIADLQSDDALAALDAETKLKARGQDAIPALSALAKQPPCKGQRAAVRLIGDAGGAPAAEALVDLLVQAGAHLKKDIVAQLIKLDKAAIDPLIAAIPRASQSSLGDIQAVLSLRGDKATVDKIVYTAQAHLSRQVDPEGPQPDPVADRRFRANTAAVLRAMTGHSMGFNSSASEQEQKAVLEKWIDWWGKNRVIVDIK